MPRDELFDIAKRASTSPVVRDGPPAGYSISLASGMHAANSRPCSIGTCTSLLIMEHECRNAHCRKDRTTSICIFNIVRI